MNNLSIGDLADWIIEHRKGNAFKDDTWENLVAGLQDDMENNNLVYVLNPKDQFIGIVTFIRDPENKILFIRNILISEHTALVIFVRHFREHFDGYHICANRDNEDIMYNTHRLIHLLTMKGAS